MAQPKRYSKSQVRKFSEAKLDKIRQSASWRLPTQFLTPEQQATRRANAAKKKQDAFMNEELVPESGLTRKKLQDMLAYESQLNYGDAERQLKVQRDQLVSNRDRDAAWYDVYRQNVANMQKDLETQNVKANEANVGMIESGRRIGDAQDVRVADELRQRQEKLNLGGPSQAGEYQSVAAQSANSRDTALRAMAIAANERARGGEALIGSAVRGADMLKSDALGRYAASDLEFGQKERDLTKNKAAFLQKAYEKAISDAQDAVLERKVFEATLDKNKSAEELARDRLNWQKAYQQAQLGIMQQNADSTRINATRPRGSSGGGSSSKQTRASSSQIQSATTDIGRLLAQDGSYSIRRFQRKFGDDWGRIRNSLLKDRGKSAGMSPLLVDAAIDQVAFGGLSPANRKRLRAAGFRVADFPQFSSKPKRGPNKGK
jgi:hypothetical protein